MKHCWKDKQEFIEEQGVKRGSEEWCDVFTNSQTCMLEAGHDGEHVFTSDDELIIKFL
jgi:hypothetical protein